MEKCCDVCANSCYKAIPNEIVLECSNNSTGEICENFTFISDAEKLEGTVEYNLRQKQREIHTRAYGDNPFRQHSYGAVAAAANRYGEGIHNNLMPTLVKEFEKEMQIEDLKAFYSPLPNDEYQASYLEIEHDRFADKLIAFSKIIDMDPIEMAEKTSPFMMCRVERALIRIKEREALKPKEPITIPIKKR